MERKIVAEALNPKNGAISYLSELRDLSKENRKNPTEAELKIWSEVLGKKKTGFTFLRQKPINRFILDFYCAQLSLAIEIDGGYHKNKKEYDSERDLFLRQIGIRTVRFSNDEILNRIEAVRSTILSLVKGRSGEAERD